MYKNILDTYASKYRVDICISIISILDENMYMCVSPTNVVIFSNNDEDVKIRAVFDEVSSGKISLIKEDDSGVANASPRK